MTPRNGGGGGNGDPKTEAEEDEEEDTTADVEEVERESWGGVGEVKGIKR
jgi:hypothetical protein